VICLLYFCSLSCSLCALFGNFTRRHPRANAKPNMLNRVVEPPPPELFELVSVGKLTTLSFTVTVTVSLVLTPNSSVAVNEKVKLL